jgi:hypothetical protein
MTTKYTPGPWDWRDTSDLRQAKSTRTDGRYGESVLCASYDYDRGPYLDTTDANRALIGAAPDLLAALVHLERMVSKMRQTLDDDDPALESARAAIAKATKEQS